MFPVQKIVLVAHQIQSVWSQVCSLEIILAGLRLRKVHITAEVKINTLRVDMTSFGHSRLKSLQWIKGFLVLLFKLYEFVGRFQRA